MLIDSHCHPDDAQFAGEAASLLQRAAEAGVGGAVAIAALPFVAAHAATAPLRLWTTVGIHPHEAANAAANADAAVFARLSDQAADPRVIAIGEIGLDYHYDNSPRAVQLEVFRRQLDLAVAAGLPVSIHCRDAWSDCFAELESRPGLPGVFHCFTGGRAEAERALALGWRLSFSGMLTFAKADALRQVAAEAPADRILVETDAPYLAPVPHRGKRNEPAWVAVTAAALGRLRGWSDSETAARTSENFFRLFPRAAGE